MKAMAEIVAGAQDRREWVVRELYAPIVMSSWWRDRAAQCRDQGDDAGEKDALRHAEHYRQFEKNGKDVK